MSHEMYAYELRGWYPHLKPADVAIWEAYVRAHPKAYDTVQYDVAVGSGPGFDTVVNPETGGDDRELYQRKIDVIAFYGNNIDIIEVKPSAGTSALGQVRGYRTLYMRDFRPPRAPRAVVLTDVIGIDMPELAAAAGVVLLTP